ncbi:MAG: hypothetical protein IKG14_03215 [Clostridia bacterium]|nr:hypothetical protein [Clostridia bacterium]
MDNASKALIIVGEILIAMMVVGVIVYSISNFGRFSKNMNQKLEQNAQIEFNNTFYKYERRIDITADEIVSIINFAKNSNDSNELYLTNIGYSDVDSKSVFFVDVLVDGNSFFNSVNKDNFEEEKIKFLNNYSEEYFKCNVRSINSQLVSNGIIQLTPSLNQDEITFFGIDNSDKGTQLVRKINFQLLTDTDKNHFGKEFNMRTRDLFVIN